MKEKSEIVIPLVIPQQLPKFRFSCYFNTTCLLCTVFYFLNICPPFKHIMAGMICSDNTWKHRIDNLQFFLAFLHTLDPSNICRSTSFFSGSRSFASTILWSSIYYTHFGIIQSTSDLYCPLLSSYQPYQTTKSKGEHHCFYDHHPEWYLTWLSNTPCCGWYLLKHKKRVLLVGEIQEETVGHEIH